MSDEEKKRLIQEQQKREQENVRKPKDNVILKLLRKSVKKI